MTEEQTDLLSIGEFARLCNLSISALRFYGDSGVLVPARTDAATGYRYYAPDQLRIAELIRQLRALDMPITEIESFLSADRTTAEALVDEHFMRLQRRMDANRGALEAVHTLLRSKETLMSATTRIPGGRLATAIKQVLPAAGRLEKRDYPAAVLFELREDGIRLVATDGHRLAVRDLPAQTAETGRTVIGVEDAAHVASTVESAGEVMLAASRSLSFEVEGRGVEVNAASDSYPDYESILGRSGSATLLANVHELNDRLAGRGEVMVLDLGEQQTSANGVGFSGRYKGADLRIGFNPGYLAEAIGAAVGPDVILHLGGPLDPVTIRSADDGTFTWLVMPIRLKDEVKT